MASPQLPLISDVTISDRRGSRDKSGGLDKALQGPQRELCPSASGCNSGNSLAPTGELSSSHAVEQEPRHHLQHASPARGLCDIVISVDGVEFNARKIILCGCSHYFRVLFTRSWSGPEKRVHKIPGTSPDMMELVIEYAYTRTVPVTANNVEALLTTADQFNVMGIVTLCCEFLKSQLCLENCIGIWRLMDHYYCPDLCEAAHVFIFHHFEEVTKVSREFLELSINELKCIIEKNELNVKRENVVFDAILKWIAHDLQNRRRHICRGLTPAGY